MNKTTRTLASGIAFAAAFAAPAFAGGLDQPIVEVVPAPVMTAPAPMMQAGAWTGFYAGGSLGYGSVSAADAAGVDFFEEDADGATLGLHAGYMYDFGSFVLGGELERSYADISGVVAATPTASVDIDHVTRLKLRAGYDAGAFMPYVTAGSARVATTGAVEDTNDGNFAGLGVDYKITDSLIVGGEVLQHQFDDVSDTGVDVDATTFAARVSFQF